MNLEGTFACFKHNTEEGTTDCILKKKDNNDEIVVISEGHSSVHHTDTYSKPKGRKVTLRRALRNAPFSKERRKAIWRSYFQQTAEGIVIV